MATKKPAHERSSSAVPRRRLRLTGALGPKATTMLVIAVLTGGLVVGEIQHSDRQREEHTSRMTAVGTAGSSMPLAAPDEAPAPKARTVVKASAPASSAVAPKQPFVTIAGCLERNDEAFRLKDTEGDKAPKARSWKSGFLKKASAPITVVDAARVVPLADHVGRRVSVTGTLAGREMKARSVRRLASSCS